MLILKDSTKKHPLEVYLSDNDGNIDIWVLDPTTGEDILIAFLNENGLNLCHLPLNEIRILEQHTKIDGSEIRVGK